MIIAGTRPPYPSEVARRLRARMAQADEVGEPRSGDDPTGRNRPDDTESAEDPHVTEDGTAN